MAITEDKKLRPLTEQALHAHIHRTLLRALALDLAASVNRLQQGMYLVPSTTKGDVVYCVTGDDVPLECTCEAQFHMPLCVHRAAVLLRRWQADGAVIAVTEEKEVVVVTKKNAAHLAYPVGKWPALVDVAPPTFKHDPTLDNDLVLTNDPSPDFEDFDLVLPEEET